MNRRVTSKNGKVRYGTGGRPVAFGSAILFGMAACAAMLGAVPGYAETLAGTAIVNTGVLRYDLAGAAQTIASNTVTLTVAERLDVRLSHEGQGVILVAPPSALPTVVPLTLTNADNGSESFAIAATLSAGTIMLRGLSIDVDGDGRYDPSIDLPLVNGGSAPLAAGQSVTLFAILAATEVAGVRDAALTVTARAITGSGTPASGFAGGGDSGSDALVGPTGAAASVVVPLATGLAGPSLFKSQSVRAADGSQAAVRDSVITYTLEARFDDAVTGAQIVDAIPVGTVFVPGSLTLDGAPLSDAAGTQARDAQDFSIVVAIGQVAPASVHTVQFKAKIQ